MPPEQRYVTLHYWMLDSDAFRELTGYSAKLLLRLAKRHNGSNNGRISMAVREAESELGCSRNHAAKCFKELEAAGFIHPTQRGAFDWKKRHATTWRLTWLDCGDEPATKDFMRSDRGRKKLVDGRMIEVARAQKKITVAPRAPIGTTA